MRRAQVFASMPGVGSWKVYFEQRLKIGVLPDKYVSRRRRFRGYPPVVFWFKGNKRKTDIHFGAQTKDTPVGWFLFWCP